MDDLTKKALTRGPGMVVVVAAVMVLALVASIGTAVFAEPAAVGLDSEVGVSVEPAPSLATSTQCMVDRYNETKPAKVTSLNCTSNDVRLAQYTLISGGPTCEAGTNILVTLKGEFVATASTRWDVGAFIGVNGNDPNTLGSTCYQAFLDRASTTNTDIVLDGGPFYNGELKSDPADTCGDIQQGQNAFETITDISIKCQDTNGDRIVDVPTCTVWNNSADTVPSCTSALQTSANTTAKCTCGNVPVAGLQLRGTISTSATGSVTLGQSISDSATLSGVTSDAGGTITFRLYGPSATAVCTTTPVFTSQAIAVNGPGTYSSGSFTPTAAGSYYWVASYSGDANNVAISTNCGDSGETSVINKASPSITTTASPTTGTAGVALTVGDTATLSGGSSPTGSVTFTLYSDNQCTSAVSGVSGSGTISSGSATYSTSWTPSAAGTFYWKASYPGDSNNNSFTTGCGGANEEIVIGKASPSISTSATAGPVTIGGNVHDTATVSGGSSPTGNVRFDLYGPSASPACTGTPVFTSSVALSGGSATSGNFAPTSAGTYYWIATYLGDANNNTAATSCGDANESSVIGKASPSISTAQKLLPNDSATLSGLGGSPPGGTLTFKLFAPSAPTCSGTPAFSEVVNVTGNATYSTNNTDIYAETVGTWRWLVEYSGDTNNTGTTSACGVENFTITNSAP